MGSFIKTAGGVAASILVGVAPTAASAQPAQVGVPVIRVGCSSAQLSTAIAAAIAQSPAVLRLSPLCTYLTAATLNFTSGNIAIVGGPSTAIKADPAMPPGPVINVAAGATLRIRGIFVLGGRNPGNGGGINDFGTLVLNFVTLTRNETGSSGGGLAVQGIGARALVANSVLKTNTATMNGGAIVNTGTLTLFKSRLLANAVTVPTGPSGRGGGILTDTGGNTRIIQSTVSGNTSARLGGGITNSATSVTSLVNSLVVHNKASNLAPGTSGGGILNENPAGGVTLTRSIVRANTPDNCAGTPVPGCVN